MIRLGSMDIQPPLYWQFGLELPESLTELDANELLRWGEHHRYFREKILNMGISRYGDEIQSIEEKHRKPNPSTIYKWEHGMRVPDAGYRTAINSLVEQACHKQTQQHLGVKGRLEFLEKSVSRLTIQVGKIAEAVTDLTKTARV